ncbi:MAG: cytochrome c1 [Pseudomonadota bacterium]
MKEMNMKSFVAKLAGLVVVCAAVGLGSAQAANYPKNKPREQSWSFAGPFGKWDIGQLQRGFKIYREVCASCHSLDLVAFRDLEKIGYSPAQVKAIAAEYEVPSEPNADGEVEDVPAKPADRFPSPYANVEEAASANNGAAPPDMSLLAKARAPERGFPTFVFDVFTMYAENGPDYIYSLMTGYKDAPEGTKIEEGTHYNPYFIAGEALAMANPLSDDQVDYDDGTPQTVDQYAKDISAFLMWTAEPGLVDRKRTGFMVMIFLIVFAGMLYMTKKKVWAGLKN